MKNTKRLMFGVVSSLLLAAGFSRAADRFDPVSLSLHNRTSQQAKPSPDCMQNCDALPSPDCMQNCDALLASPDCMQNCDAVTDQE